MIIKGLDFDCLCLSPYEQYDVFDNQRKKVGYIRLCCGELTCSHPDASGKIIYHAKVEDCWSGRFKNRMQRGEYLCEIADIIVENIGERDTKE